ncbi:hypothetical protein MXB_2578 [Myxobolus squamalis]|nr:hypothetical protein MXB_2578 [Myxobolus squamalis]
MSFILFFSTQVIKTPTSLSQENLAILWLVHMAVRAWVGTVISHSFHVV